MTTVALPTYRYEVSCCWCGTNLLTFTSTAPIEGLELEPQRCQGSRCRTVVKPRVRVVE